MPPPKQGQVAWEVKPGFKDSYKKYLKTNPKIKDTMTEFNRCKRATPPEQLPGKMKDHKLDGPLKGIMDCHFYKPLANGGISLLRVCQHADIKGKRGAATAKLIK